MRDLVLVAGIPEHITRVRVFATEVWAAWGHAHLRVAKLVESAVAGAAHRLSNRSGI